MGIKVRPLTGSEAQPTGRGGDPRDHDLSKEDKKIKKMLVKQGLKGTFMQIQAFKNMTPAEQSMSTETNRTERLPEEKKMSGGPVKKKKKVSSGYMGGGYVKPKKMGHGGMAYRGRTYAYGGRVSKYKG